MGLSIVSTALYKQ